MFSSILLRMQTSGRHERSLSACVKLVFKARIKSTIYSPPRTNYCSLAFIRHLRGAGLQKLKIRISETQINKRKMELDQDGHLTEQETFFGVCFAVVTWSTSTDGVMRHCLELFCMLLLRSVQHQ